MDIADIRKQNLEILMERFDTQKAFAIKIDKPEAYISQIKKGYKKSGERITMGDSFARDIETALGLPHGVMDRCGGIVPANQLNNHGYIGGSVSQSVGSCHTQDGDDVKILTLDFYPNANFNEPKEALTTTKQMIAPIHADFATIVSDNHMSSVIRQKSLILVDGKQNNGLMYQGKVYVLNMHGLLICRYLERMTGGRVRVYSEQDKTGQILEQADFDSEYQIMGAVVWQAGFLE